MPIDRELVELAARSIASRQTAVVLAHQNPDGDAIGSSLAVALMLGQSGYQVTVSWPEPVVIPEKYRFLPGWGFLSRPGDVRCDGVVLALDCANLDRLEEFRPIIENCSDIVNIDHHPDNSGFGTVNLVDPGAAATAEMIYLLSEDLGFRVDLEAATCLYVGLVTDTGRFQFSNTSRVTLEVASRLVEMGVQPNVVYENVYQSDSLAYLKLTGKVLQDAWFEPENGLIYAFLSQDDMRSYDVAMDETEDLIDSLRSLGGHRVAALFKELADGRIRVSLRSRNDTDIGRVARLLGGGGHRVAAGYTSDTGSFTEALSELEREL